MNAWSATITSDGSARLYFNMSAVNWWIAGTNGNGNFAYFYNSNGKYAWSAHSVKYSDSQYYVVIPSGTWNGVILTRNNTSTAPSWDNKWNQTGDITLSSTSNYISKFSEGSTSVTWGTAVQQASTGKLTASSTNVFTAVNVTLTPSLSSNADINAIKSTSYSVSPSSNAKISGNIFSASAEGTYTITATITYHPKGYTELTSTTTASAQITVKVPAEETHNVTISYKCDDKDVQESMTTSVGVKTVSEITAPDIKGHSFVSWTLGNGITIKSGSTTSLTIGIITKSTGTYSLTANYVQNSVYFVNTARWKTVNVYAWSDDDNRNSDWPGEALTATGEQIGGYDVYKFTSGAGYENVIFNSGAAEQTPDLAWTTGKYYVYNSEGTIDIDDWYDKNEVADLLPDFVISLAGSMNGWNTELSRLVKSDDGLTASVTVLLEADTYTFKMVVNDKWLGSQETMTRTNCSDWSLEQGDGSDRYNCQIIADQMGEYKFVWTYATNTLSVVYPVKGEVYEPEPAPDGYRTIYLNTKNLWHSDNAKFYVHSWGNTVEQDIAMSLHVGYVYKVYVPDNNDKIIFIRMAPAATSFSWESEYLWNQTADLVIPLDKDCYTIQGWGANQGKWTTYGVDHNQDPLYSSSVPSACPDVMLQGFYWDSNQDKYYGCTRWYNLQQQAAEISSYFDLIWLPPSAMSSGGVGYHPKQYSNQNSDWGTRAELETLIQLLHDGGTKVIADMVVNHIDTKEGWCTFYEQDFGEYGKFQIDGSYISQNDEMNSDSGAGSCQGAATGAWEDGYGGESNYGSARDLAHGDEKVRQMCRAYAQWMINEMKYDGFRYDYCKGFHMSHVDDYNATAGAYFSMIEYWDGDANVLWDRIVDAGENTLALDFGTKYSAINDGIAKGDYSKCLGSGLLGKGKGKWAVTFIDNHDTFERNDSEFGGNFQSMSDNMSYHLLEANAFILSMPGVPCIFYPHWKKYGNEIKKMILARKAVGVHSESAVQDEGDYNGYRATVTGANGTLILELGNRKSSHAGYTEVASGAGYSMWVKPNSPLTPELTITPKSTTYRTSSMSVTMRALGKLGESTTIYYTVDGSDPMSSNTKRTYTGTITIEGTMTLKAYAESIYGKSAVQTHVYTYDPPQELPITIAFKNTAGWSNVYLYSWDSSENPLTGGWPGLKLTNKNIGGFYYHQFNDNQPREINFILHDNGSNKSADLLTYEDVCYAWENGQAVMVNCSDQPHLTIYHDGTKNPGDGVYEYSEDYVGTIFYKRIFTPGTWETLYLPFVVEKVTIEDDGEWALDPWDGSTGHYYLAKPDEVKNGVLYFDFTTTLSANTPYIIQFPDKNGYYDDKVITFHGAHKWNELSKSFVLLTPNRDMQMGGNETLQKQELSENVYVLRATNDFILQRNPTTLQPFECYVLPQQGAAMQSRMKVRLRGQDDDVTTELDDVMQPTLNPTQPMYNMLGQQVDENYHGIIIQNGYKYIK